MELPSQEKKEVVYLVQKLLALVTSEIVLETPIEDIMKVCHWWIGNWKNLARFSWLQDEETV